MKSLRGFTLIELSIVLVIVALIIGGIIVGKELVNMAELRAQMSQIEKFQTAIQTFRVKYEALPGDITASRAAMLGLATRTGERGRGNGDRLLQDNGRTMGTQVGSNEKALFWRDLGDTALIAERFPTVTDGWNTTIAAVLPRAVLKKGDNYIAMWSGGPTNIVATAGLTNGKNYMVISPGSFNSAYYYAGLGMTVIQAQNMDTKLDDGMPQSGKVTTMYPYHDYGLWIRPYGTDPLSSLGADPGTARTATVNTCYDNEGVATDPMKYTTRLGQDVLKCALSIEVP